MSGRKQSHSGPASIWSSCTQVNDVQTGKAWLPGNGNLENLYASVWKGL